MELDKFPLKSSALVFFFFFPSLRKEKGNQQEKFLISSLGPLIVGIWRIITWIINPIEIFYFDEHLWAST